MTANRRSSAILLLTVIAFCSLAQRPCSVAYAFGSFKNLPHSSCSRIGVIKKIDRGRSPGAVLAIRGGGPRYLEAVRDIGGEVDKNDVRTEALSQMKFAYRACFAAFIADLTIAIIDKDARNKPFTWLLAVDMLDSLNLLVFGFGLRTAVQIYAENTSSDAPQKWRATSVTTLSNIMSKIWMMMSWAIVGISMSIASTLREHAGWSAVGSAGVDSIPFGVLAVSILGYVVIPVISDKEVAKAIKSGASVEPLSAENEIARAAGVLMVRHLALSVGSFALLASIRFVTWLVTPAKLVRRIFTITNFLTPYTIAALQLVLYRNVLRAVIAVTEGEKDPDVATYSNLFEAQKKFYKKVGDVVKSAAIFSLLPYAFALAKPYLLPMIKRLSSSLAEKL